MKLNNALFADKTFYYMDDAGAPIYRYHYHIGVSYDYENEDLFIEELKQVFKKHEIYYFDPDFNDWGEFDGDPLNRNENQDEVLANLKTKELISYLTDVKEVLERNDALLIVSTTHRSFFETDNIHFETFEQLYNSSSSALITNFLFDYIRKLDENYDESNLRFIIQDKKLIENLEEFKNQIVIPTDNHFVFTLVCDLLHSVANYILKIQAKRKKLSKKDQTLLPILQDFYANVKYDKYKKVREAAKQIAIEVVKNKGN